MKMNLTLSGRGDPIVLVGGGMTGSLSWLPHMERLSKERKVYLFQLISVQYGLEDRPLPSDYSLKTESQALDEGLADLEQEAPIFDLVAWSFGAEIALDYALDHPSKIRSLTLIEPPALWVLKAKEPLDQEMENFLAKIKNFEGEISDEDLEELVISMGLCPPIKSPRELPQWSVWSRHRNSLRNRPAAWQHTDDLNRLNVLKNCPLLLIKGEGSNKIFHKIMDALASELTQAEVIEMPYGHTPHVTSMEPFLEKLKLFHKSVENLSSHIPPKNRVVSQNLGIVR